MPLTNRASALLKVVDPEIRSIVNHPIEVELRNFLSHCHAEINRLLLEAVANYSSSNLHLANHADLQSREVEGAVTGRGWWVKRDDLDAYAYVGKL